MKKLVLFIFIISGFSLLADIIPFRANNGLYGLKDSKGEIVQPPVYRQISRFSGDIAAVQRPKGLWGLINNEGKQISACKYDSVSFFQNGLARVNFKGKYGFINQDGQEVITTIYDKAHHFENDSARVSLDGKWMLIDKKGAGLTLPVYEAISKPIGGLNLVKADGFFGLISTEGLKIAPVNSESYEMLSNDLIALNNSGWTIYKSNGQKFNDKPFADFAKVSNDIFKYQENGTWGIINKDGRIITRAIFKDISELNNGMIRVLDKKYGFIDTRGNIVIAPKYDHASDFSNGMAQVRDDGKWAWINIQGKTIIDNEDVEIARVNKPAGPAVINNRPAVEVEALRDITRAQQKIEKIRRATQPYYYNSYQSYSPAYYSPSLFYSPYRLGHGYYRGNHHGRRSHSGHCYRHGLGISYKNWHLGLGGGIHYHGTPHFKIKF